MRTALRALAHLVGAVTVYAACASDVGGSGGPRPGASPEGEEANSGARVDVDAKTGGTTGAVAASGTNGGSGRSSSGSASLDPTPAAKADEVTAGSRLKPRMMVTRAEDGAILKQGVFWTAPWWDSTLGAPCAFAPTESNGMRCVPEAAPVGAFFADKECTVPVAPVSCSTQWKFITVSSQTTPSANGCGGAVMAVSRIYSTKPLPKGSTVYLKAEGTACTASPVTGDGNYVTIDKEIAPGSLVAGTSEEEH